MTESNPLADIIASGTADHIMWQIFKKMEKVSTRMDGYSRDYKETVVKERRPRGPDGRVTHCVNGHELKPGTYWENKKGHRNCKRCGLEWQRKHPRNRKTKK